MKNKLFSKNNLILLIIVIGIFGAVTVLVPPLFKGDAANKAQEVAVRVASSQIQADGTVVSKNEAVLHFQTGGKLTYLPVKEGDKVYAGETIGSLDTYALQRQLQIAANTYETAKNANDQMQESQKAGVAEGQQRTSLDTTNHNAYSDVTEQQIITNQVARIVDNSTLTQNTAQLNVDLAKYAMQLASLTSPISGVLMHADVSTSGVNITPATTFVIDDPNTLVFRANVLENDIDYVAAGQNATIKMANGKTISGTVEKIYPGKITLPTGDKAYQVDIASSGLLGQTAIGETGTVLIDNVEGHDVVQIPSWLVLAKNYVWIDENGTPTLKKVTVGMEHGNYTEITGGLTSQDKVIENPKSIISNKYRIL